MTWISICSRGPLTSSERQQRFSQGLCLVCGTVRTPQSHLSLRSKFSLSDLSAKSKQLKWKATAVKFRETISADSKCHPLLISTRQVQKILRSPALSTGQAIGASLLSLARCGGLWDYPRALKAGLLHPTATNPDQLGSPSLCILCHAHLDCKPMAHLVVDCTHPTVVFARVDTQLLQAINDTRVQIFDCTLHTTTTTTTITTTPASPSLSTTSSNSSTYTIGTSAIWDSVNTHTPIDNYQHSPRPTSQSSPSSPSSPSDFSNFFIFTFSPTRVSSRQSALLTRKFPGRPRTQWKKTPLPAGPPPQTPTRLLLAAHPPRPIYRILGRMIF
ncbi:hypothetical protein BASA60_007988 [Batrachochytrium salamandrivorans]|nr:hypothetical protein BASA60_007988 [Batrachochytrium salamandrivorans]